MLVPQALLAALCFGLGLFPRRRARARSVVCWRRCPDCSPLRDRWGRRLGMTSPVRVVRSRGAARCSAWRCWAALASRRRVLAARTGLAMRRVPTWGCGGELSARTEYTATAFSKPLMMIFRAVYRPTRQVEALAEVSPYFPQEVRYRSEIEPTFERYVYGPLLRAVLRVANGMKVLQAGSLHAYLAYVLVLGVLLLLWLGGTT